MEKRHVYLLVRTENHNGTSITDIPYICDTEEQADAVNLRHGNIFKKVHSTIFLKQFGGK